MSGAIMDQVEAPQGHEVSTHAIRRGGRQYHHHHEQKASQPELAAPR